MTTLLREVKEIEATQFASMVPTPDIRRGIEALLARRQSHGAELLRLGQLVQRKKLKSSA